MSDQKNFAASGMLPRKAKTIDDDAGFNHFLFW